MPVALFVVIAVFGVAVGITALVTTVAPNLQDVRRRRKALVDTLGERPGAEPDGSSAVTMERPEGRVRVDWVSPGREPHMQATELVLDMPCHLPGLTIRPWRASTMGGTAFSDRFTSITRESGAEDLASLPAVKDWLLALSLQRNTWQGAVTMELRGTRGGSRLQVLKEGWVENPGEVEALVDGICGAGRALREAWDQPWLALAERFGLGAIQRDAQGLRELRGELSGYAFRLEERVEGREASTRMFLALRTDPPLQVVRKERARAEGWAGITTGNPVLDMCVAVRSGDMESVKALLSRDEVTEALLPLIHGREAQLDPTGLNLEFAGYPREGLEELAEEVAELARVFRAQATEDSPRA